jgi:signal transduction histidine kinase
MAADTQRLNRLISRLLDLAKADMQRPHEGASCDLADVLARIADGLGTTGFTIDTAAARIPAWLRIDGSALETALTTLIDNARAAGADQVTLAASLMDRHLQLTVSDNGSGIAPNDRPRIFEPFFTSKRAQGGTGLGLPIARALIEGNGGSLTLEAKSDGTCFLLILPCWPPGT